MNSLSHKQCTKCKEVKDINEFYFCRTRNCYYSICKTCNNRISREDYYRNKEKYNLQSKIRSKEWYQKNKTKAAAKNKLWRRNHPDKSKEIFGRWASKPGSLEKKKLATYNWQQSHPDKVREYSRNRRNKIKGGLGNITESEWVNLCNKYGNICLRCKKGNVKLTIDHIVPIHLGGSNTIENAQPLCQSCNSKKRLQIVDYR